MRAILILAFLAGALVAQTDQPEPKGTIHGVVRDTSGIPVAGITVQAYPNGEPRRLAVGKSMAVMTSSRPARSVTLEGGQYELTGLAPATYILRTERGAYRPVKVGADEEVALDIVVPAIPAISGRVLDRDGGPAVDAFVWLLKPQYQAGVLRYIVVGPKVTAENGAYSFDSGLESNRRYYVLVDRDPPKELVTATPPGLKDREPIEVPTYYPSATELDMATPVMLQPGEQRAKVDIKVASAPYYCVDGNTQGPADFTVRQTPLAGTQLVRLRSSSGGQGEYQVCGLPAGAYRVATEHAFTDFAISSSDVHHVNISADPFHLRVRSDWDDPSAAPEIPQLDDDQEAALLKLAALMGMPEPVSDDNLRALTLRLVQFDFSDPELQSALSRSKGDSDFARALGYLQGGLLAHRFLVHVSLTGSYSTQSPSFNLPVPCDSPLPDAISPGDYSLEFQTYSEMVGYPKEVTYNDVTLPDGVLRIAPGAGGTLHIVMARDVATIAVNVTDADGKPVPNAVVTLDPDSVTTAPLLFRMSTRGMTDQNGSYTSPPIPPGKYRVLATAQMVRWGVPEDLERVLLVLFQAKGVEVAPKTTLQVAVEPVPIY